MATFLKSTSDVLGKDGVLATLKQGALYGLVIAMVVEVVLTQAALHLGPLSVSQPLMVIVNPFVKHCPGHLAVREHFEGGAWKLPWARVVSSS